MTLRTDTVAIPIIDSDLADTTTELRAPWLRPPVTATYRRPNRWQQFADSDFVRDVTDRLPLITQSIGGLAVAYFVVLLIRGLWVLALIAGVAR